MESPATWPPQLTKYLAERLQCAPALLTQPGVHTVVAREPRTRVFHYLLPLWIMAFERTAIVSAAPDLAHGLERILGRATLAALLDDDTVGRMRALAARSAPIDFFGRDYWLYCTRETFAPRMTADVVPVPPEHPEGRALRERHHGEVFGVFSGGELISRSSIKTESDDAWEMAVTTSERHRRRGLGASVVSRATEYILECGKVALYNCDITNAASLALAESLGYRLFARGLMWTLETMWGPWFWGDNLV